jgi:hypothetical protein
MQDTGYWNPAVKDRCQSIPRQHPSLTAATKNQSSNPWDFSGRTFRSCGERTRPCHQKAIQFHEPPSLPHIAHLQMPHEFDSRLRSPQRK